MDDLQPETNQNSYSDRKQKFNKFSKSSSLLHNMSNNHMSIGGAISEITELSMTMENNTDAESPDKIK